MFYRTSHAPARRAGLLAATAVLVALAATAPVRANTTYGLAEMANEFDVPNLDPQTNTTGPTGLEWDFLGNAMGCIPAQFMDGLINPWQAWHDDNNTLVVNNTTRVFHAAGGYTSVTLSGSPLAVPAPLDDMHGGSYTGPTWGNGGSFLSYHPGLNAGYAPQTCTGNPLIWKRWIYKIGNTTQYQTIPIGNVTWPGGFNQQNIGQAQAAVVYLETTGPAGSGTWYWTSYVPSRDGTPPTFLYTNNGQDAITLGVVGIQTGIAEPKDKKCQTNPRCKENQGILDTLNAMHYLPPNHEGSLMTPVKGLDGVTLQPGDSVKVSAQ